MPSVTVTDAKYLTDHTIMAYLTEMGFELLKPIGYRWQGPDCAFTQPPVNLRRILNKHHGKPTVPRF